MEISLYFPDRFGGVGLNGKQADTQPGMPGWRLWNFREGNRHSGCEA